MTKERFKVTIGDFWKDMYCWESEKLKRRLRKAHSKQKVEKIISDEYRKCYHVLDEYFNEMAAK